MILAFKPQFVQPILDGTKIHTIREDSKDRWKPGKKIHFATGVRTKNYNNFLLKSVIKVQGIHIIWSGTVMKILINGSCVCNFNTAAYHADYSGNGYKFLKRLAINDGFQSVEEFYKWFDKNFAGKIIHWTKYRY